MTFKEKIRLFAIELFKIDAIKFGEFKTKVGLMTPVYCDLRVIVSYPKVLDTLASLIAEYMKGLKHADLICGVPYTALPIATIVSVKTGTPMVMRRKEAKDHGTKKLIEGKFVDGDKCLIVEDVVTSGSSILETVNDLTNTGIKCTDAIVLLNRQQGGEEFLHKSGIKMHALLNLTELMNILLDANLIKDSVVKKVQEYLLATQVKVEDITKTLSEDRLKLPFSSRIAHAKNPVTRELLKIMAEKATNLCVAADLSNATDILNLAESVGPHICILKTHIDIIEDFHENFIKRLKDIAKNHRFIICEDRKFADIGNTVQMQYSKGIYKINTWASLVTAHSIFGKGLLDAIQQSKTVLDKGVFLLAEVSSEGSLIDDKYTKETIKLANDYPNLITGLVCQKPLLINEPGFVQLTPGCQLNETKDNLGQQYNSPEDVILEKGGDIAVVGRGITKASEPDVVAKEYKERLWGAYLKRVGTK